MISPKVRQIVRQRDKGCIFCNYLGFEPTGMNTEIMHYVGRGRGGMGIPENLAVGCIKHHRQMDQGSPLDQQMMRFLFRDYLRRIYPDWDESKLYVRNRWDEIREEQIQE